MKHLFLIIFACMGMSAFAQSETIPPLQPHFSALIVEDIDRSIEWYQNTLGLELLNKTENADFAFKQANLKRDAILLELIELGSALSPEEVIPNFNAKTKIQGIFKIGFSVANFDQWMDHLKKLEVDFQGNVVNDPNSGKKMIIIKDPDGNRIQFFEQ